MKSLKFITLFLLSIILFGCASLEYTGEDSKNVVSKTSKTQEDFVFNTFKKSLDNINVNVGISKTPVQEILVLYVQIENLSYETPYIFRVSDLKVFDSNGEVRFITSNNYLNIYQAQEASSMNSMSVMGATLTNIAGITSNYNEINQTMLQNASQTSSIDTYTKMTNLGNGILQHSIQTSSTINPRKSQYYYFFFQNNEAYPIAVKYKTLNYQFNK